MLEFLLVASFFAIFIIFIIILCLPEVFEDHEFNIIFRILRSLFVVMPVEVFMFGASSFLILVLSRSVKFRVYEGSDYYRCHQWIRHEHFVTKHKKLCGAWLDEDIRIYIGFLETLVDLKDTYGIEETLQVLKNYDKLDKVISLVKYAFDNCTKLSDGLRNSVNELKLLDMKYSNYEVGLDTAIEVLEDFERIFPGYKLKTTENNKLKAYKKSSRVIKYDQNTPESNLFGDLFGLFLDGGGTMK